MAHEPKGRYTSFESILHRLVHERIDAAVAQRSLNLGAGSARKDQAVDTAAAYSEEIGTIRGLREAQRICQEVSAEMSRDG